VPKAGAGLNLRFLLRMEGGDGVEAKAQQIAKLKEILAKICDKLRFGETETGRIMGKRPHL